MNPEEIKAMLGSRWMSVESYINGSLSSDIALLQSINGRILSHSGKQLRPLISMLVAMACSDGGAVDDSCRYAAAAELLHNATLLHDDVADSSDQRRGSPTIRSLMGPSVSVLVGDYWLVKAMELILSASNHGDRVIKIFSKTLSDLAEGEMLQLQKAESGDTGYDDYIRIIYNKTASLFVSSSLSAAISVGASPEMEDAVREFSTALGLAFQIRDDIFDYSQDAVVGKPVGVDIMEQKITLPLIGALQEVPEDEASAVRSLVASIRENPGNRERIMDFVRQHDGVAYAEKVLDGYITRAVDALDIFPDTCYRRQLADVARYVGVRSK